MNLNKASRRDNRKSRRIKHHVVSEADKKDKRNDWKKARKQKEEFLKLVLDNNG